MVNSELQRLVADLASSNPQVRVNAVLRFTRYGRAGTAVLVDVLRRHERLDVRWYAAYILGLIGDPIAVPALIQALDDHPYVAQSAHKTLKMIGTPEAIEAAQAWRP